MYNIKITLIFSPDILLRRNYRYNKYLVGLSIYSNCRKKNYNIMLILLLH